MQQNPKRFAERLNLCLDDIETPSSIRERTVILSKMLEISRHQALNLLEGHQYPDQFLCQKIANEFEVDLKWLLGEA